jgi:6-phosphofructokinase
MSTDEPATPTKIAILTGGGDCLGLNTVSRAIVKAATLRGWESIGVLGGFDGLIDPVQMRPPSRRRARDH